MALEMVGAENAAVLTLRLMGSGLYEEAAADKTSDQQLRKLVNLVYGPDWPALATRQGWVAAGQVVDGGSQQILQPVTFLVRFQKSNGTLFYVTGAGSAIAKYDSVDQRWEQLASGLGGGPVSTTTYRDLLIMADGSGQPKKFDGTTVSTLGGSPPVVRYVTHHHDRLYLWGSDTDPSRLWISALGNPEDWSTPQDAANFQVDPNDTAGKAMGLAVDPRLARILLFKERAIYELLGTDPNTWETREVSLRIGCGAPFTIAQTKDVVVFLDQNGEVRTYQGGGKEPEVVSRPVRRTLGTMNWSARANCRAFLTPDDKYLLAFPSGSATEPSTLLCLDLRFETWHVWNGITAWAGTVLDLGGKPALYTGGTGAVYSLTGTSDLGSPIPWEIETPAFSVGPDQLILKRLWVEGTGTISLSYAMSEEGSFGSPTALAANGWTAVRPLPSAPVRGHAIRLKASGSGVVRIDEFRASLVVARRG